MHSEDSVRMNMEQETMTIGSYVLLKEMGSGNFGSVYLCEHTESRKSYAGKLFTMRFLKEEKGWWMIEQEVTILQKLTHYRTIKYEDIVYSPYGILVIMELVRGRNLLEAFPDEGLVEAFSRYIFKQLLEGLDFLHKNGIIHRDIKLENVMIERNGNVKLIDYGLSEYFPGSKGNSEKLLVRGLNGTPNYYAPELLKGGIVDKFRGDRTDIWAAGIFLFTLAAGFFPFKGEDDIQMYEDICSKEVPFKKTDFSPELVNLPSLILEKDPERRASISDIMTHPWMKAKRLDADVNTFYGKFRRATIGIKNRIVLKIRSCIDTFPHATRNKMTAWDSRACYSCPGRFVHEYTGKTVQRKFPLLQSYSCDQKEYGCQCGAEAKQSGKHITTVETSRSGRLTKVKRFFKLTTSVKVLAESERAAMSKFAKKADEKRSDGAVNVEEAATQVGQSRRRKRKFFAVLMAWLCCKRCCGASSGSSASDG